MRCAPALWTRNGLITSPQRWCRRASPARSTAPAKGDGILGSLGVNVQYKAAVAVRQEDDETVDLCSPPSMTTIASSKWHWAWFGGRDNCTNISLVWRRCSLTLSVTVVYPPSKPYSSLNLANIHLAVWRFFLGRLNRPPGSGR